MEGLVAAKRWRRDIRDRQHTQALALISETRTQRRTRAAAQVNRVRATKCIQTSTGDPQCRMHCQTRHTPFQIAIGFRYSPNGTISLRVQPALQRWYTKKAVWR
jgi:hypothetical protein